MSASNSYANMTELIRDYINQPIDDYLNQSISINNVVLTCDVYRVEDGISLTSSVFSGCTAVDSNTQIIIGRNLSVANGVTLIPPYRCKGVIIGCPGIFINNGTISMTARGASGEGKNIALVGNYSISAIGGSGGTGVITNSNGNSGNSPTNNILSCAGGGSGACAANGSGTDYSGSGGSGTSFSGGAGGGGTHFALASNGSSTGGAGGNGGAHSSGQSDNNAGGAGNPGGIGNGSGGSTETLKGSDGTGGLLVIFASIINQNGILSSNGSKGGIAESSYAYNAGGGGSGAGCIVLLSSLSSETGTYQVNGGEGGTAIAKDSTYLNYAKSGGAGGNGICSAFTVSDMILSDPSELSLAMTLETTLEDITPKNGRLLGLMDKDELMYEYNGVRHRAVDDTGALDLSKIIPPGQRTPDEFEVHITDPQNGQGIVYDGIQQEWVNGSGGAPVGTIIIYFGYTAPNGYLICDGTEYAKVDYPYLAAHLADMDDHYSTTTYVGSDSDHFKVPDLRGEFLRGAGTNSHSGQGDGGDVGEHQNATEIPNIWNSSNIFYASFLSADGFNPKNEDSVISGNNRYRTVSVSSDLAGASTSRYMPRPTNTSVLYCIKYN